MNEFLADLPEDTNWTAEGEFRPPTKVSSGPHAKVQQFSCQACHGTGVFRGVRIHQDRHECFAYGGKGYFLTSEADRRKARLQRTQGKAKKLAELRAAFDAENPGISAFLDSNWKWSVFAGELLAKLNQYGSLSEKQVGAIRSMQAKIEAKRAEKAVAVKAGGREVDLGAIRSMFERATANGYKKPVYRAAGLVLSRAPDSGKNPGAIYVKEVGGEYLGKLLGTAYTGRPAPGLDEIAADPKGAAVRYGQQSGTCSCCGRELSDPASIALGIGPICADKWGF